MTLKWRTLLLLSLAELLAMSVWFSATAVMPALAAEWHLSPGDAAWLTMAVQVGFVAGALSLALFNLSDLWPPRYVCAIGAWTAAGCTALMPALAHDLLSALPLRFATGFALAAVYPVGMKIMATWTKDDRGLGLGLLVGALTVGNASPHLVRGLGGVSDWETVVFIVSLLAAIGGCFVWWTGVLGPYRAPTPRFQWRYMALSFRSRGLRLANLGYLGHMWELYAMWAWIPTFLGVVYSTHRGSPLVGRFEPEPLAALGAFAVIASGGLGSLAAGRLADGWGRTNTTIASMALSGACALSIGWAMDVSAVLVTIVALVWGFAIVADSAQFSTSVSELGEPAYMGTLLTTQTAAGFLLTMVSIRLVPMAVGWVGWRWTFAVLALGPMLGSWAMHRLKHSPDAARLAGGRG